MLAERLSALRENQEKWKSRVDKTEKSTPESVKTGLQQRKLALLQASDDWKKRVRSDEEVNKLDSGYRLKKSGLIPSNKISDRSPETPKMRLLVQKVQKSNMIISCSSAPPKTRLEKSSSEESSCLKSNLSPLDDVVSHPVLATPKRNVPKAAGRRLPSKLAQKQSPEGHETSTPSHTSVPTPKIRHYETSHSDESNKENLLYISTTPSCSREDRTPKIGVKNCGIALKKVEYVNPYPELMLVRFKGSKFVDVRLVEPTKEQVHPCATFLLITPKKLFVYHGEYTSVLEKAKAAQIVCDIITGKEVCSAASKCENIHEIPAAAGEFWRLLGGHPEDTKILPEVATLEQNLASESIGFEDYVKTSNRILRVRENGDIEEVLMGDTPRAKELDSKEIRIFDFETEIYVWVGRFSNRAFVKPAMEYAENLKTSRLNPWILIRKITEGLQDCMFRYKFPDWKSLSPKVETPQWKASPLLISPPRKKIASPGFEEAYKNDDELAESLSAHFAFKCHPQEHVLVLEDTELLTSDRNVFTEDTRYYKLVGETLEEVEELCEFFDRDCYVIEWKYRVERFGICKLDGTPGRDHETGRQRVAFFYWLGRHTTKKEQGLCALALRNRDKERHEHIRVEQGTEPPMLVSLFSGRFIISSCENTSDKRVYLVRGSTQDLCIAEELESPSDGSLELRPQAAYIFLDRSKLSLLKGDLCSRELHAGAMRIADLLARVKGYQKCEKSIEGHKSVMPKSWVRAPRMFRIYETEGDEVQSVHWDKKANFTFQQEDLRDTMIVDQETHVWIWSEVTVSTFALKVANLYLSKKYSSSIPAIVICRTKEPEAFNALFPTWKPWEDPILDPLDPNSTLNSEFTPDEPQELCVLLEERTRFRTIEEVRTRSLPKGCDMKNLEQYLSDEDFQKVFKMGKDEYQKLPRWKQISLKKETGLF